MLECDREERNRYDSNAVGVYKREGRSLLLAGQVPRELSDDFARAFDRGRIISCSITGPRENQRRGGLEVPCLCIIQ